MDTTNFANWIQYAPHGAVWKLQRGNGLVHAEDYNNRLQLVESYDSASDVNTAASMLLVSCPHWGSGMESTLYSICPQGPSAANNGNLLAYDEYIGGSATATLSQPTFSQVGPAGATTIADDGANRLTGISDSGGWSRQFSYDQWGNMSISAAAGGWSLNVNAPVVGTAAYNANNQRTDSGLSYDAAGNLNGMNGFGNLTFDAENRLLTETSPTPYAYAYDGEGRRVLKSGAGNTTVYVYDAAGRLSSEYNSVAPTTAPPCATCYLTTDHLGSVRLVTDASQHVISRHDYLPFGEEVPQTYAGRTAALLFGGTDAVNQKFTAKERDAESGLDYFGARYYGSALGRFTSPDWSERPEPVPYADFSNPQSLNLYAYIRNNPLAQSDPDGHCPPCLFTLVPDQRTMDVWKGVGKGWVNMHLKNDTALGGVFKALGVQTQVALNADQAAGMAASPIVQEGVSLAAGFMGPKGEEPVGPGEGNAITPEAGIATPKVDAIAGEIERGGYQVTPNEKTATQEGNVTITHPDQPGVKLNLRTETHPLEPGGAPVRHVNVETVTPRTG